MEDTTLDELIDIFGRLHLNQIVTFLPSNTFTRIQARLKIRTDRFEKILKYAFADLIARRSLNVHIQAMYNISALSSSTPEEVVITEIVRHFLSFPLPLQEAKRWGCYTFTPIKAGIDYHQKELEKATTKVFQLAIVNSTINVQPFSPLTLQEQQALFKSAAIKAHGQVISWGRLLFLWARLANDEDQQLQTNLKSLISFHQLLIPNQTTDQPKPTLQVSFKTFAIDQAISALFPVLKPIFHTMNSSKQISKKHFQSP